MQPLSGLDAAFLHLETPEMPMHVGALNLLELPADYTGDFLVDMRRHVGSRLHMAPAFHRALAPMPLNLANPAWIEAQPDLFKHVVGIALPRGSGLDELERQVARLHMMLLDRTRPLWKFHVFEGLADGPNGQKRFAVYSQLHHAAVDGAAAVALSTSIFDLTPTGRQLPPAPRRKRNEEPPPVADMVRAATSRYLEQIDHLVRTLPATLGALGSAAVSMASDAAAHALKSRALVPGLPDGTGTFGLAAPRTRLNTTVTRERTFAALSLPLAEIHAARKRQGASFNDALLFICGGALRRYFKKHGELPAESLVAGVPMSVRQKGDERNDNQVVMSTLTLGTHLSRPVERLAHVMAANATLKKNLAKTRSLTPQDYPSFGVPWILSGLVSLYSRAQLADRLPAISNVTISNVPGVPVQLYMAGARVLSNYPTSVVVHGVALNITVETFGGSLDIGLMSCPKAMTDLGALRDEFPRALEEFKKLPAAILPKPAAPADARPAEAAPSARPPRPRAARRAKDEAATPALARAAAKRPTPATRPPSARRKAVAT